MVGARRRPGQRRQRPHGGGAGGDQSASDDDEPYACWAMRRERCGEGGVIVHYSNWEVASECLRPLLTMSSSEGSPTAMGDESFNFDRARTLIVGGRTAMHNWESMLSEVRDAGL